MTNGSGSRRVSRIARLVSLLGLAGCAHAPQPQPATPAASVATSAASAAPPALESLLAWLPADAVLVARVDVAALDELGFAEGLLSLWLDPARVGKLVPGTGQALLAIAPHGATTRAIAIAQRARAPEDTVAPWTSIAPGTWLVCLESCEGFAPAQAPLASATELRSALAVHDASKLVSVRVAVGRDAKVEELRARLLDSTFSVLSELHTAAFDVTRSGDALAADLKARFGSAGLCSNAALQLRGLSGQIADELEAAGLRAESDQLMAMRIDLMSAIADTGEAEKAELHAQLALPIATVPAIAIAWRKLQNGGADEDAQAPPPF